MAQNKTKPEKISVESFLNKIKDPLKKEDCTKLTKIMGQITKQKPVVWGTGMIGFGNYHYKYESGREGDMFLAGFAPRAKNITIYIMPCVPGASIMKKLGKYKSTGSCIYINKLEDIDTKILTELIKLSIKHLKSLYPAD